MGLLRLILALAVVIAHSTDFFGLKFVGGQIAVQAFYIISGFYMSLILNEKYINKNGSYKLFITNRFLRLFPIYWLILFFTILFSAYLYFSTNGTQSGALFSYTHYSGHLNLKTFFFLIFTNIFLFFQDIVMFLGLDNSGALFFTTNFQNSSPPVFTFLLIPQAWTVGVEIMFYIFAPFIVRRSIKVIAVLIFMSLLLRVLLYHNGLNFDPWTYRFFPTELLFFLLGNVSYRIYTKMKTVNMHRYIPTAMLALLFVFTFFYNQIVFPKKMYVYFLVFFLFLPFVFQKTKKWKWDTFIGDLSYPVYISHVFILSLIHYFKAPLLFNNLGITLAIYTIIFSIPINLLISKNIEKYRQRRVSGV
ncbi:acyltransferase [Ferruginibacter lapsinanis]|uniref:acyltransferase family protein n=1 Tax=Ferruginibacter lapsinanis TaxID=563172 RepID=UPI001E3BC55B|nr:acyltransferase [Ferruginibacter lapsinanis]UEG49457.1 acyltransferase [Ferruginibacter lapsinanis]